MTKTYYDKTGASFSLDHEHNGIAYVRPLVKVVVQTGGYEGDFDEEEYLEPAEYLISIPVSDLFDVPPIEAVNTEIADKKAELEKLKNEASKALRELNSERSKVEYDLRAAKRKLDEWMNKHRVMTDLGKLLDGEILYPLTVSQNSYHKGRDIPRIPVSKGLEYLVVEAGNFNTGKPWRCKSYGVTSYGNPFQFFETEEERSAVISSEFELACDQFRKKPNFDTTSHTTSTQLHYGTLMEWVKAHPFLKIPDDIQEIKQANDTALVEKRKAQLEAELASIGNS